MSGAAHASTIDFSYTFADGLSLTGSLNGTLDGDHVDNVSDVSVTFNGATFSGPLYVGTFSAATNSYDYSSGAAVISTNASLNNFILADSNDPQGNGVTNYFYFFNGNTPSGLGSQEVFAVNANTGDIDLANPANGFASGTWSLHAEVAPVPVPAAFPLLLSGLGVLVGAVKRRRGSNIEHA
jgi:hypothetical protein